MKFKLLPILLLCICYKNNAQEVKHQTEELASVKKGFYTAYIADKKGDAYHGGIHDYVYQFTDLQDSKTQPGVHHEFFMIRAGNKARPEKNKPIMFLPDNEAFPITYVEKVYEGNKAMQNSIGYAPRINPLTDINRVVFLDGMIYLITNWKSKDDYFLQAVLEYTEKPMGKLKMMKEVISSPKKMAALDPHTKLQNYLNAAYAKQQKVYNTWIQDPVNASVVEGTKIKRELTLKAIQKKNDDYKKSDEYKRIQEINAMGERRDRENNVTVRNNTSKDAYIYYDGSSNADIVRANGKGTFNCKKSIFFSFTKGGSSSSSTLLNSSGNSCGSTVTIN